MIFYGNIPCILNEIYNLHCGGEYIFIIYLILIQLFGSVLSLGMRWWSLCKLTNILVFMYVIHSFSIFDDSTRLDLTGLNSSRLESTRYETNIWSDLKYPSVTHKIIFVNWIIFIVRSAALNWFIYISTGFVWLKVSG